ncbi:MAG: type II toxin-antitoxin system Phd/YefM family antitoxin [Candidatus Auribacterota bacterium]|nr:type II toxin-antitoxin system Phd/YefM family antitoxin [Candidatus Auribacterota bacterium]
MKASVVDLRYKMSNILKALDRNEAVTILYHGKEKGIITPTQKSAKVAITDHPFFGMKAGEKESVEDTMNRIRGTRY